MQNGERCILVMNILELSIYSDIQKAIGCLEYKGLVSVFVNVVKAQVDRYKKIYI